ncbi:lipopolysaccharide heptosyltransferase II [Phycisphaeraceae bacterium D3-23]
MPNPAQNTPSENLLVVMPTWLGDCVMATPTLRALRGRYPDARITALVRHDIRPILDGLDSVDRILSVRQRDKDGSKKKTRRRRSLVALARRLSKGGFDTAVLLPNSFKSAALVSVAAIPRRVGYDRDGRGMLLTDRLIPRRHRGKFLPVSTLDYYLGLARYLGAEDTDHAMELATRPESDEAALKKLRGAGFDPDQGELLLINPGAQKAMKRWPAERFGALVDTTAERLGLTPAVTGSPAEREVLDAVIAAAKTPVLDLPKLGMDLHRLKSVVKMSRLMVTNDTGPRHIAAAFDTPVVTLFGPTTPQWTQIGFEDEVQVTPASRSASEPATMEQITVEQVVDAVCTLHTRTAGKPIGHGA